MAAVVPIPFWAKLAAGLASFVTLGFLAWAGVVWDRTDEIVTTWRQVLERVIVVETRIVHLQQQFARMQVQIVEGLRADQRHLDSRWHREAGLKLAHLEKQMQEIQVELDRELRRLRNEVK